MRVVGFFLYCFASMLVPIGIGFGLMALRAPQYRIADQNAAIESGSFASLNGLLGETAVERLGDMRDEHPSSLAAAGAAYGDSTLAFFIAYEDGRSARKAAASLVDRIPTSSKSSGPGGVSYGRSDTGARGLVRTVGRHVVWVQGPSRDLVDSRFNALPGIERNPGTNFANTVIDENLGLFIALILVWVFLQAFIWPRYASSAGTAAAPSENRKDPACRDDLVQRLSEIENAASPIRVHRTGCEDEVLVEWRYETGEWASLMAAGSVSLLRRLRLRLDEKRHRILARDEQTEVAWEVGTDGAFVGTELTWKAMMGIVFIQHERAAQYGLKRDGDSVGFGEHYSFEFNVKELRAPVIAIAGDAGWDYRPVVAFNRLFGG